MKKTFFCFAMCGMIFGCRSSVKRVPTGGFSDGNQLTFATFLETVKKSRTIEEALPLLEKNYYQFMHSYTLMYDSFSLHESTMLDPRAIVFGQGARFVFSFNGDSKKRGGYAFETMEFDSQTKTFLFREVAFKKQMTKSDLEDLDADEIEFEDEFVRVSKANVNKCTQCHGTNPNPIWETYFIWPGSYGSDDDGLNSFFYRPVENRISSLGRQLKLKEKAKDIEFAGFVEFIKRKSTHPRYRHIPNRAIDIGFERYIKGEKIGSIDISAELEEEQQSFARNRGQLELVRPNTMLMIDLQDRSAEKLLYQLGKSENGQRMLFKLAWIEICSKKKRNINTSLDPLSSFPEVFSAHERQRISEQAGVWEKFYNQFLNDEFQMENEKIDRMVRAFGVDALAPIPIDNSSEAPRSRKFYRGRIENKQKYAKFIYNQEDDDLPMEALRAYVAKGYGFNLSEFVTNMRRVPTFREGGWVRVYGLILGESYYTYKDNADRDCPNILERAK